MVNADHTIIITLITKLELIASIKSQQKINISTLEILNQGITTTCRRTLYDKLGYKGYSREDLYNFMESLSNDSFRMLRKYQNNTNAANIEIMNKLKSSLIKAKNNLTTSIRETYICDQAFVVKLQTLAVTIEIQINSIENNSYVESLLSSTCDLSTVSENSTSIADQ